MRTFAHVCLLGIASLAAAPALAAPSYSTNFNQGGQITQATPQNRTVSGALPASNGSGTFVGSAYAGLGRVNASTRTDCVWASGFSGAFSSWTTANATADDFIITGPGGSVHGTFHVRVSGDFDGLGGFPDNGAAYAGLFWFHAGSFYSQTSGQVNWSKFTTSGSGWLSGVTTRSFDLDVPLEADYPVNVPFSFHVSTEVDASCYGNVFYNPGMARSDGGSGGGVSVGSGGTVMDLPAGYTLSSAAWNIQNNVVAVDGEPRVDALRLELASANPTRGDARMRLSLPRGSRVRAEVYDAMGRAVRSVFDGWQEAGVHELRWDGRDERGAAASAGLYFVRMIAGNEALTLRVVRMR